VSDPHDVVLQKSHGGQDLKRFDRGVWRQPNRADDGGGDGSRGHHFLARSLRPERVPDFCVGGSGHQSDHANSFRAQFFAQGLGEAECAMFRSDVGGRSGEDAMGGDGEIIHDGAAALHEGERGLRDQERAGEVGIDYVLPERERKFIYGEIGVGDAGVVDEDIEAFEFAADGAEKIVD